MMKAETAMRQAPMTIQFYLIEAVSCIDKELGEGYAKKHPDLIATFITACATDFATSASAGFVEN